MEQLVDVDALLKIDESCASESKLVFAEPGSNAMDCANTGLRAFDIVRWIEMRAAR